MKHLKYQFLKAIDKNTAPYVKHFKYQLLKAIMAPLTQVCQIYTGLFQFDESCPSFYYNSFLSLAIQKIIPSLTAFNATAKIKIFPASI